MDTLPHNNRRNYWKQKGITAFGRLFPNNYDGPIREFWERQLSGQAESVVDLACGNGALTWIADEVLRDRPGNIEITGVDYSDIDPFDALGRNPGDYPRCRFIGNTDAEDLPFANGSVDVVISQYGIEYSDLDRSIPEVVRILKPGGRMAFILHDLESSVVQMATRHQDDFIAVDALGIHDHALRLHALGSRLRTAAARQSSPEMMALTSRLNDLTNRVRMIVQDYTGKSPIHDYMNQIMSVFAAPSGRSAAEPEQQIIAARDMLQTKIRLNEHLRSAALDEDDRRHLVELIESAGFTVIERAPMHYRNESNIGTALVAVGRAPGARP